MNISDISISIKSALAFTLFCSILNMAFSGGKFSKSVKFVSGICMLICVLSVVSPVIDILSHSSPTDFPEDSFSGENITSETGRFIAEKLSEAISSRFGLPKEKVKVTVTLETRDLETEVKNVTVLLSGDQFDIFDDVADFVTSVFPYPCTVIPK